MYINKIKALVLTISILGWSIDAQASWQQMWQTDQPDIIVHTAVGTNGVGASISNVAAPGIRFFNADTGQTICQFPLDPVLYNNSKPSIYAGGTNRFIAFYLYRSTAASSMANMKAVAFDVSLPTPGHPSTCGTPAWTWTSSFTLNDTQIPLYRGFFAKDGQIAGLIINDNSSFQTKFISIDPASGVTRDTQTAGGMLSYTDMQVGASENAQFVWVSNVAGTRARSINAQTKLFGTQMLTGGTSVTASAMNDNGILLEASAAGTMTARYVSSEYPGFLSGFTLNAPLNATFGVSVAVSKDGKVGAVGFQALGNATLVIQSFTLTHLAQHTFAPINSFTDTSVSTLQNYPKKLLALDNGLVIAGASGGPGVPEAIFMPRSGAATQIDAPGSFIDATMNTRDIWIGFKAVHDNTYASGSLVRKFSYLPN
jgi:hypothetical protein